MLTELERRWIFSRYLWCLGHHPNPFPFDPEPERKKNELWEYVDLLLALGGAWDKVPHSQLYMLEKKYNLVP